MYTSIAIRSLWKILYILDELSHENCNLYVVVSIDQIVPIDVSIYTSKLQLLSDKVLENNA